jgi:hypothetical protein
MVAVGRQLPRLHQVAEPAVGDPQTRARAHGADLGQHGRHQRRIAGFTVRVGAEADRQAAGDVLGRHQFAAQHVALDLAQRLEPLGDILDLLAVQGGGAVGAQAGGQGIGRRRRQDGEQAGRGLGEQAATQADRRPPQFAVGRRHRRRQDAEFLGAGETLMAAAVMFEQGIGNEMHEDGKGNDFFVGGPTMALEDTREEVVVEDVVEQAQTGFGQRQAPAGFGFKGGHGKFSLQKWGQLHRKAYAAGELAAADYVKSSGAGMLMSGLLGFRVRRGAAGT